MVFHHFFMLLLFSFGNYNHYRFLKFLEVLLCLQDLVILKNKNTDIKKYSLTYGRFLDMQWSTKRGKSAIISHATSCQS